MISKQRQKRIEAIARGDCSTCFKRPATDGLRSCTQCRRKQRTANRVRPISQKERKRRRDYSREWNRDKREQRISRGLCTICGITPARAREKKKTCANCGKGGYSKVSKWLKAWRAFVRITAQVSARATCSPLRDYILTGILRPCL